MRGTPVHVVRAGAAWLGNGDIAQLAEVHGEVAAGGGIVWVLLREHLGDVEGLWEERAGLGQIALAALMLWRRGMQIDGRGLGTIDPRQ